MTLQTYSGLEIRPLQPRVEDFTIEDIAHGLSHACRFAGQVRTFYSVAQHSVLVSHALPTSLALWGLLHDASEAYLSDVPAPVKVTDALAGYRAIEALLQRTVYQAFGLTGEEPSELRDADLALRILEARALMTPEAAARIAGHEPEGLVLPPFTIRPWTSMAAKAAFLQRFQQLTGGR